ncbi:transcriptional repressor LexA [Opitutus terrae]|nr:transcriptional repressor LexA [Opitutus terrae]
MTETQRKVLDFIRARVRRSQRGVTFREVQAAFGWRSSNAAQDHVRALREAGLLRSDLRGARSILPVTIHDGIPIFGTIPAGIPIDAASENGEFLDVEPSLFDSKPGIPVFALRVRGHSMVNAGIKDGDVVVLAARDPRKGDVVAALVDKESTLKRYCVERGRAYLKAEGPGFDDILPAEELIIQGVMIGLIRKGSC